MSRVQISTSVSAETRKQVDWLTSQCGYTLRDALTLAVDDFYWKSVHNKRMQVLNDYKEFIDGGDAADDDAAFDEFLQNKYKQPDSG